MLLVGRAAWFGFAGFVVQRSVPEGRCGTEGLLGVGCGWPNYHPAVPLELSVIISLLAGVMLVLVSMRLGLRSGS